MKKKISFIFAILIFSILFFTTKSNAATVNTKKIDLYVLNDSQKAAYNISIPKEYAQSYTIKVTGNTGKPKYTVVDGKDAITVDTNGVVKPKTRKVTIISGGSSTVREEYEIGEFKVRVSVDGQNFDITVNVIDYANVYANKVMDDYISKNIKSSMTQMEKLKKICEFVASYDYSPKASGTTSMILTGGGDCWASTSTIITMSKKVGLYAHARYGVNDSGAGSGHRNAVVYVDGKCYVVEAGYDEPAPRYYSIVEEEGGFDFRYKPDGTYKLVQYDGKDTNVVVPSTYNGKKVTEIAANAFFYGNRYSGVEITSVKLPDTITTIGDSAFFDCEKLTNVNIPNSVETIGNAPFALAGKLNVQINKSHPRFTISDGMLYNKAKTELITVLPQTQGAVVIPDNVIKIEPFAFYYSKVDSVKLGKNLKTIEKGAFMECGVREITIPKSVTEIGERAFYYSVNSCTIEDGSKVKIGKDAFNSLKELELPDSITSLNNDIISYKNGLTIYGNANSYAQKYAKENGINFALKSERTKLGDVNGDGEINTKDAREVLLAYIGKKEFTSTQNKAADVNKDGEVNTKDARQILLYYIGKIDKF